MMEKLFEEARTGNDSVRQDFLNRVYTEHDLLQSYVLGISYTPNFMAEPLMKLISLIGVDFSSEVQMGSEGGGRVVMYVKPSPMGIVVGGEHKSKMGVCAPSFDHNIHQNYSDFLCSLVDHEGQHAHDFYEGTHGFPKLVDALNNPEKFVRDYIGNPTNIPTMAEIMQNPMVLQNYLGQTVKDIKNTMHEMKQLVGKLELRAYDNQIAHFDERNCSDKYRKGVEDQRLTVLKYANGDF